MKAVTYIINAMKILYSDNEIYVFYKTGIDKNAFHKRPRFTLRHGHELQ
jgi:hypothetical protein